MASRSGFAKLSGLGLIVVLLLVGTTIGTNAGPVAQGAATQAVTAMATAVGTEKSATARCIPTEVAVFTNAQRLHVKCAGPTDNILYFATGTANNDVATHVLMVLTSAMSAGKPLAIVFNPDDLSGASIGCLSKDCRLIISVAMLNR